MERADVTGVLLAGGRGQRMGGVDKGWVDLDGRPLVAQALQRLSSQVDRVVISANRHLDRYRRLGHAVVTDSLPGHPGPLAGALGALREVSTPWILLAPVDMPWLPVDTLARLAGAIGGADIAVAHDGRRLQPLVALIRSSLGADLSDWLAAGGGRVVTWYDRHDWIEVGFPGQDAQFTNLNTPHEVALAACAQAGHASPPDSCHE
ncbi:molybdenum cofactor guanylyltransferase [Salinicola acroporae]|uniref:Molybdenum cofactor guanylyltransferase n=1 Tax=Salinicola acroporae TaxID=1541440 RepID=A0ABT6I8F9_9GAMM|nr:molybdenum cofactor guanylyltransferase [Salinicola acroporae]